MQLAHRIGSAICLLVLSVGATQAQVCTLALGTNGTLALSADGTILGSQEGLGVAGTFTVVSIGSNTISVSAPTRVSAPPPGYNSASEQIEVAYWGASGLSAISQGYTSSTTGFGVGTIGVSLLTVHNRIVNPNGFASGSYTTRTVVTCS